MPAPIAAAAIMGGSSLLGGMMGAAAERKRKQEELAAQMQQQAFANNFQAQQNMGQGEVNAFQNIMASFSKALGR